MKVHNYKTIHKLNNNESLYGRVVEYAYRIVGLLLWRKLMVKSVRCVQTKKTREIGIL